GSGKAEVRRSQLALEPASVRRLLIDVRFTVCEVWTLAPVQRHVRTKRSAVREAKRRLEEMEKIVNSRAER
ncbi:hypothetical protein CSUI_009139, partial [Cystoisospora suis]